MMNLAIFVNFVTFCALFGQAVSYVTFYCDGHRSHKLSLPKEKIEVQATHSSCYYNVEPLNKFSVLQINHLQILSSCQNRVSINGKQTNGQTFPTQMFKNLIIEVRHSPSWQSRGNCIYIEVEEISEYSEDCDIKTSTKDYDLPIVVFSPSPNLLPDGFKDNSKNPFMDTSWIKNLTSLSRYIVEVISTRPASTVCHLQNIKLPSVETPSCHAVNASSCQWTPFSGIALSQLNGGQFMISSSSAEIRTKSRSLDMDRICLYVEYFAPITDKILSTSFGIKVYSAIDNTSTILAQEPIEMGNKWTIKRLVLSVPLNILNYQLAVQFQNLNGLIIRKLYGCNPYGEVDRTLVNVISAQFVPPAKKDLSLKGGSSSGHKYYCPVGFTGQDCKTGCGKDRWGLNCQNKCSGTVYGCLNTIFCVGLECRCATGYTGVKCSEECTSGWYGAGCAEKCGMCAECDRFTGRCFSPCQPGYQPPFCKNKYVQLTTAPTVRNVSFSKANFDILITNNTTEGVGIPVYYLMQLKGDGDHWRNLEYGLIPKSGRINSSVSNLDLGTSYLLRIILKTLEDNDYIDHEIKVAQFKTSCMDSNILEVHATNIFDDGAVSVQWNDLSNDTRKCPLRKVEILISSDGHWKYIVVDGDRNTEVIRGLLRDTLYMIKVRPINNGKPGRFSKILNVLMDKGPGDILNLEKSNVTSRSAVISWKYTPVKDSKFNLTYECVKVLAGGYCFNDYGSLNVSNTSTLLSGLSPHRKYLVNIKRFYAIDSAGITLTTRADLPETVPILSNISVTNTTALIFIKPPDDCSLCNGYLTKYRYSLLDLPTQTEIKTGFIESDRVQIENLMPLNKYLIRVFLLNTEGWNYNKSLNFEFTTTSSVPSEVKNLFAYKIGRNEIGLRWSEPEHLYGKLESFVIEYSDIRLLLAPRRCLSWPDSYCSTVQHLQPDKTYTFSVSAKNDVLNGTGFPSFVTASTMEGAPGAPENLRALEVGDTVMSIQWMPPKYANGLIRSFLIKIDQIEASVGQKCCTYYPKKELPVQNEEEYYSLELTGLQPGSLYAVSVMAETVFYGPAAILYVNTTTSLPSTISTTTAPIQTSLPTTSSALDDIIPSEIDDMF